MTGDRDAQHLALNAAVEALHHPIRARRIGPRFAVLHPKLLARGLDHHLRHTVCHRWDPEHALPAILLRDAHRFDRWGTVAAGGHAVPELIEIVLQASLEDLKAHSVHPRCPAVPEF